MINPDKIRDVIGSGGKTINEIIAKTGVVSIDIEQNGLVMVTAKDGVSGAAAQKWIEDLTREVAAGELYDGEVVRLMDFGAFVQLLPGKDGFGPRVGTCAVARRESHRHRQSWRQSKGESPLKSTTKVV